MGYVRMMRSGSIHCSSNASVYLPIVRDNFQFQEMSEELKLTEETINSAKNLECDITYLIRNYSEGTEYFRVSTTTTSSFYFSLHFFLLILVIGRCVFTIFPE